MVAIPKPSEPVEDPQSYRPISLLCVSYKIFKRLIYNRVEPIVDPLLPKERAAFRHGKSTVNQVVLLTQNIEDSFEIKKKAGVVFTDVIAAYLSPCPHLQAVETSAGQAHGPDDHGTFSEQKLHFDMSHTSDTLRNNGSDSFG